MFPRWTTSSVSTSSSFSSRLLIFFSLTSFSNDGLPSNDDIRTTTSLVCSPPSPSSPSWRCWKTKIFFQFNKQLTSIFSITKSRDSIKNPSFSCTCGVNQYLCFIYKSVVRKRIQTYQNARVNENRKIVHVNNIHVSTYLRRKTVCQYNNNNIAYYTAHIIQIKCVYTLYRRVI